MYASEYAYGNKYSRLQFNRMSLNNLDMEDIYNVLWICMYFVPIFTLKIYYIFYD